MAKFVGVSNAEVLASGFEKVVAGQVAGWDPVFDWSRVDASAPPEPPAFDASLLVKGRGTIDWIARAKSGSFLGINSPKVYEYEIGASEKWGSTSAILEDLRAIRLTFGRQFGGADLLWPYDPTDRDTNVPTADADIYSILETKSAALTALFNQAETSNIKVVLTFMTLGGAASMVTLTDPLGEITQNIIGLNWSADHESNVITDLDGNTGVTIYDGFATTDRTWVLGVLDLRSAYKKYYIYLIARQAAQLLQDLQAAGVPVFDNLLGIEIFNEVNTGNMHGTLNDGAPPWADAVVAAVKGFSEILGSDLPSLWWPSQASWSDAQTFGDIENFVSSVVSAAQLSAASRSVDISVLTNQDYHWYHYRNHQRADAPIMSIQDNVSALSAVYSDAGLEVSISICETGSSVNEAEIDHGSFPYVASWSDADAVARFQAREVWRRVGTALCCGTAYVGWHTHMASSKGDFSGTGLREDSGNESTAVASDATTRYSYWALRRLAGRTVGGLGISSSHSGATRTSFGGAIGEVIHPSSHPSTGDYGTLDRANGEQMLVILHFEDAALSPHVYVLFIDSVANKTVSICVRVSCSDTSVTSVRRYPSIPDTIDHGTTGTSSSYNTGESPDWGEWYTEDALPFEYTVAAGDDPILIHSDAELDFTIPCSDVAPVAPPSAANRRRSLDRLVRTGGLSGRRRSS